MKKTDRIVLVVTIFLACALIFTLIRYTGNNSKNEKGINGIGIESRVINYNIKNDKISCEDTIIFNLEYLQNISYSYTKDSNNLKNIQLYINDNQFFSKGKISSDIFINKNTLETDSGKVTVKLKYETDIDYITRYTNKDCLNNYISMYNMDYFNNLTINLTSDISVKDLYVENAKITKGENNKYSINIKQIKESQNVDILFNIDANINNSINSKYISELEKEYSFINERIFYLVMLIVLSIELLIMVIIVNKKRKVRGYRRETTGLISPILAETVIDGKIGMKELIMTTIINLNTKGNIKIIDNDTIELVTKDNLENYEKSIVKLLFENERIRISDINNIFATSNKKTLEFADKMDNIKEQILEKIKSMNIFSTEWTMANQIITTIATLVIVNLTLILLKKTTLNLVLVCNVITILYYMLKYWAKIPIRKQVVEYNKKSNSIGRLIIIIYLVATIIISSFNIAKINIIFFITIILTIILNIYVCYRSKTIVLTSNGKVEQQKLLELKKYINDYSLIKDRDTQSVILWDEYLAYATAFGVPNKVVNSIYEDWYNINISLQIIRNL